jgi:(p)ppGpp synthase/HD superfamily hydrolase
MSTDSSGHRRYDEPLDKSIGLDKNLSPDYSKCFREIGTELNTMRSHTLVGDNSMEKFRQAIHFATWVHDAQKRKYNGMPYVTHPIRCAHRALKMLSDIDIGIAMLLHDGPEDQYARCPFSLIEALYGDRVMHLVKALTNPSKEFSDLNREKRKKIDRDHYANAYIYTKLMKMIDRLDNLNELSIEQDPGFVSLYCTESALLLEAIESTTPYASSSHFGVLAAEMRTKIDSLRNQIGVRP